LHEEVGPHVPATAVLGRLDDCATRSGYLITPVVVWVGAAAEVRPNPGEVASIRRIPCAEFLRGDAPLLNQVRGEAHPVLRMSAGDGWIAAPTAAFMYQCHELCLQRPTDAGGASRPADVCLAADPGYSGNPENCPAPSLA